MSIAYQLKLKLNIK